MFFRQKEVRGEVIAHHCINKSIYVENELRLHLHPYK